MAQDPTGAGLHDRGRRRLPTSGAVDPQHLFLGAALHGRVEGGDDPETAPAQCPLPLVDRVAEDDWAFHTG
jgi:hypothetical protein